MGTSVRTATTDDIPLLVDLMAGFYAESVYALANTLYTRFNLQPHTDGRQLLTVNLGGDAF